MLLRLSVHLHLLCWMMYLDLFPAYCFCFQSFPCSPVRHHCVVLDCPYCPVVSRLSCPGSGPWAPRPSSISISTAGIPLTYPQDILCGVVPWSLEDTVGCSLGLQFSWVRKPPTVSQPPLLDCRVSWWSCCPRWPLSLGPAVLKVACLFIHPAWSSLDFPNLLMVAFHHPQEFSMSF